MSLTLTVGQVNDAIAGIPALYTALSDIVSGKGSASDVEVIAGDALTVASLADPAIAPTLSVAAALLPVAISMIQSGGIKGDTSPIQDGQTTRNFDPGDPAARL